MKQIGVLSDTHGKVLERGFIKFLSECDEIWHAGDIGSLNGLEQMAVIAPVRAVYGNIDSAEIRIETKRDSSWELHGLKFLMTHIGGYPPKYNRRSLPLIEVIRPDVFICGHSHILKVMRDKKRNIIHLNPGACGHKGFHQLRTFLKFDVTPDGLKDMKVVELGKRGRLEK